MALDVHIARAGEGMHLGFEQPVAPLVASILDAKMEVSFGRWPLAEREHRIRDHESMVGEIEGSTGWRPLPKRERKLNYR